MKFIFYISLLLAALSVNSQVYSFKSNCIVNNWIEIDTCIISNDTMIVFTYEKYVIKARCLGSGKDNVSIQIVEVLKRTEYPVLGYNHIISKSKIDELMRKIKWEYGDNRSRVLPLFYSKKEKPKKSLVAKNNH